MKYLTNKPFAALSLIALLLVSVLLFAACDSNSPADTTPESAITDATTPESGDPSDTTADTAPDTTPESTPSAGTETIDAPAYLDRLLAAEDSVSTNFKTIMDLTMQIKILAGGMEQSYSMPVKMTEVVAGSNMMVTADMMGSSYELTFVDGILYANIGGEMYKCSATAEQFQEVVNMLGGSDDGEEDSSTPNLNDLLSGMSSADLFGSITAEKQADGKTVVTVKGLNKKAIDKVAPAVAPVLLSMGVIGGDIDFEAYETEEALNAALTEAAVRALSAMADDAINFTFTTDKEDKLIAVGLDVTITTTVTLDGVETTTTLRVAGTATHEEGNQTVKAPANAADYIEGTWDELFGTPEYSPEDLGLVPDEDGVIWLSEDATVRSEQLFCVYMYTDTFSGYAFAVTGSAAMEELSDGSTVLSIYAKDENGDIDEYSVIEGTFYPGMEDELKAVIASGEDAVANDYLFVGAFAEMEDAVGDVYVTFIVTGVFPAETN